MCTDVVHEWLPEVSGEEGPSASLWPGSMDRALLSGERKVQYCCADMAIMSWDRGKPVGLECKKVQTGTDEGGKGGGQDAKQEGP